MATFLSIRYPTGSFITMMSISTFGAVFTWLMIFVTHFFFRRRIGSPLAFRMWGYPYTTFLGIALLAGVLLTTLFTREFRMTLVCGGPFMLLLSAVYLIWYRQPRLPNSETSLESPDLVSQL